MDTLFSPKNYYDCALVIEFSLGDYLQIGSGIDIVWDGTEDSPTLLEEGLIEGVSVSYLENEECLLLYFISSKERINIKSDGETVYFFAEIDKSGALTGASTDEDETLLSENVSVMKDGNLICITNIVSEGDSDDGKVSEESYPVIGAANSKDEESKDVSDDADTMNVQDSDFLRMEELELEIGRLQKLLTEVSDSNYDKMYTQVRDMDINERTAKLYTMKLEYERQLSAFNEINEKLDMMEKQKSELIQNEMDLRKIIEAAEQLIQDKSSCSHELENTLSEKLNYLGIDRNALEMYTGTQDAEELIAEAKLVEEKIRAMLRRNIEIRQKVCDDTHNKVAEG